MKHMITQSGIGTVEVGKRYPLGMPAPMGDVNWCRIVFAPDVPTVLINYPDLVPEELAAFKGGLKRYTYTEMGTAACPVACWTFQFGAGLGGGIEVNFDAQIEEQSAIEEYLDTTDGTKNLWSFVLTDQLVVRGIVFAGLKPEAVRLFHATIRKQLAAGYSRETFGRVLGDVYHVYDARDICKLGTTFTH